MYSIERIYEHETHDEGYRVLVDRMWPRGIAKDDAHLDEWMKEIGPSRPLIEDFHHGSVDWEDFKKRYWVELNGKPDLIGHLKSLSRQGKVILLFGSKDEAHNNAVVLLEYLNTHS